MSLPESIRITYLVPMEVMMDVETSEVTDIIICADRYRRDPNEPICYTGTNTKVHPLMASAATEDLSDTDLAAFAPAWRVVTE